MAPTTTGTRAFRWCAACTTGAPTKPANDSIAAGDLSLWRGEQEGVADLSVGVAAQKGAADECAVTLGKAQEQLGGGAVGRQSALEQLGNQAESAS